MRNWRNCLICKESRCIYNGEDGWQKDCPYFPPDEISEEERQNFEEYLNEQEEGGADEQV